jgi:chromosome segregation ATPase
MSISSLVPSWMRQDHPDNAETENFTSIPTATLPEPKVPPMIVGRIIPEYSQEDHAREIFGKAAVMLDELKRQRAEAQDELKRERAQAQERENDLKGQLAEAVLSRASDSKKIGFLELENVELRNNIAALQSDNNALRELMSKTRGLWDLFGIKAPEKKRKTKSKKIDAPGASEQPVV